MRIRLKSRKWAGSTTLARKWAGFAARGAALGAAMLAAGMVAACGSGYQEPQGLTGKQAGVYASSQYTLEDRQAAATLTPEPGSFLAGKTTVTLMNSTTPANGDVNPYAIWPVTQTVGSVKAGDVLVDNFNNKSNNQGTGTTIVDVHPNGQVGVFAQLPATVPGCTGGVGLTTTMVQLKTGGWVIVGSLPSTNGKIVEITPSGKQVGEYYAIQDVGQDPPGNGDLFDLAINQPGTGVFFVKDDTNVLSLLH